MRYVQSGRTRESGFVLIFMALAAFALFGVLGLSLDLGRVYIAKNETQTFCDAAAVAAALKLNGQSSGITAAQSAVTNNVNTWNLNTQAVPTPLVDFGQSATGPWVSNPSSPSGYLYVRVRTTAPVSMYFLPIVVNQFTQNVNSLAIAAQTPVTTFKQGLAPYTAVVQGNGAAFGFNVGQEYDIQWPAYNSTRNGCNPTNPNSDPNNCFVSNPCGGDTNQAKHAVVSAWGANVSGYWGSTSASSITSEVLDTTQIAPVNLGDNISPLLSSGTKSTEGGILDQRVNQDTYLGDNDPSRYLSNPHNGRRLIQVPIVNPLSSTETDVVGFAAFLLEANGNSSNYYARTNGNQPYCAIFVGSYVQGSTDMGGGTVGAFKVKLVQ